MSADSIIPFQYDTQAFNRYSYVKNNPLKYTDPSGHSWFSKAMKWVKKNWRTIVTIAVVTVATIATGGFGGVALAGSLGMTTTTLGGSILVGAVAGSGAGFVGGVLGSKLNGASWSSAFKTGLRGALVGAISGAVAGGFGNTWNVGRVMLTSIGGGVSSEIMGGDFADGFKMALITSAYSAITTQSGNKYPQQNTNNGKSHIFQDGKSNVGMDRPGVTDYRSDTHWGMRTLGKLPFMDSFAEFHDSLLDKFKFLQAPGLNELSMIPAYGINIAATYYENYNTFETMRYVNSGR